MLRGCSPALADVHCLHRLLLRGTRALPQMMLLLLNEAGDLCKPKQLLQLAQGQPRRVAHQV